MNAVSIQGARIAENINSANINDPATPPTIKPEIKMQYRTIRLESVF
jgi:hypothetical protein